MTLRVHLTTPMQAVTAGGEGEGSVTIVNLSPVVRAFRLEVLGGADWVTLDPPELRLFPEQTGEATLRMRPPRSPEVSAGAHPVAVKVTATDDPSVSLVDEGTVQVAPFAALAIAVRPENARAARRARYTVTVTNQGNATQDLDVVAEDKDDVLALRTAPGRLRLDSGQRGTVKVRAQLVARAMRGERIGFTVAASGPALEPTSTPASLTIMPAIGAWVARAAAIVLPLVLIVVGYLLLRGGEPKTTAGTAELHDGTTTTAAPDTTVALTQPDIETTSTPDDTSSTPVPSDAVVTQLPTGTGPAATTRPSSPSAPTVTPPSATTPLPTAAKTPTTTLPPPPLTTQPALWAVVSGDSPVPVVRSYGLDLAVRNATGYYTLTFDRDIRGCAYNAVAGTFPGAGAGSDRLPAFTLAQTWDRFNPQYVVQVYVPMREQSAGSFDSFAVIVTCPDMASSFAVVDADGRLDRGSHVGAVSRTATGRYRVSLGYNLSGCAVIATGGSPGNDQDNLEAEAARQGVVGVVSSTGGVVEVQTRAWSGAPLNLPFHLVVRCDNNAANGRFAGGTTLVSNGITLTSASAPLANVTLDVQGNKLGNCAVIASTRETAAGGGVAFDGGLPGSSMLVTTIDATSGLLASHPIDVMASCP